MTRLGIDGRDAFERHPRGTGRSLATLVRHLASRPVATEILLYTNRSGTLPLPRPVSVRHIDMPGDRFQVWDTLRLPIAALADGVDLLHCPSQTAPLLVPRPFVLTVHDLIPLRFDDGWPRAQVATFRKRLGRSVRRARRIIAVSEFTRQDLLAEFPIAPDKVDVVHWGVEPQGGSNPLATASGVDAAVLERRAPFFLCFAGDAPRKNLRRVLEALRAFTRDVTTDVQLVLVGTPPPTEARLRAMIRDLGLARYAVLLGYVPDATVTALLAKAEALIFASLYEGFGLPILEAMAAGAPVITSNVTSMPEVAGDAAVLVDPTDVGAIAEAMRACYLNDRVKTSLRTLGRRRASSFTWEQAAAATIATYRRALRLPSDDDSIPSAPGRDS